MIVAEDFMAANYSIGSINHTKMAQGLRGGRPAASTINEDALHGLE
jgi:hypothetical protein